MSAQEYIDRYKNALHAVQSGVAQKMSMDLSETQPKHLRTGVNASLVQQAAITSLLIEKGIFTKEEYLSSLADLMEKEKESYEAWLSDRLGTNITLA